MADRDPRTHWVSEDGVWAVAKCYDIPNGVYRSSNQIYMPNLFRPNGTYAAPDRHNTYHGMKVDGNYYAIVKRVDLPWENESVHPLLSAVEEFVRAPSTIARVVQHEDQEYIVSGAVVRGKIQIEISCGARDTGSITGTTLKKMEKKSNAKKTIS